MSKCVHYNKKPKNKNQKPKTIRFRKLFVCLQIYFIRKYIYNKQAFKQKPWKTSQHQKRNLTQS